jgi:hypothetical protein
VVSVYRVADYITARGYAKKFSYMGELEEMLSLRVARTTLTIRARPLKGTYPDTVAMASGPRDRTWRSFPLWRSEKIYFVG